MKIEESQLFRILDEYSRLRHGCFLAEMFLNKDATHYVLCFRPVEPKVCAVGAGVCRYVYLNREDGLSVGSTGVMTDSVRQDLDTALQSLG